MFTGIVAGTGRILRAERTRQGLRLAVRAGFRVKRGESIAVAGCCLTAVTARAGTVVFELMPETLRRTKFGRLRPGDRVNLERSLRFGDRLSGHFVQGHVDGLGTVVRVQAGKDYRVDIEAPASVARFVLRKGSIAVDGVSLTVAEVRTARRRQGLRTEPARFSVALIPETLRVTTLGRLRAGDRAHLEADVLGKYVLRILRAKRKGR
ncbi:MAG TPA: riboflavin synthase [archaeon]|nr:riboflavin synthase [archaeon]